MKIKSLLVALLCLSGMTGVMEAKNFENTDASVHWSFTTTGAGEKEVPEISPEGAVSMATFSSELESTGAAASSNDPIATYLKFMVENSQGGHLQWRVIPKKGVKFTPTRVTAKIRRFGTDGGLMDVSVKNDEGVSEILETGLVPQRANRTVDTDDKRNEAKFCSSFDLEVPATLATEQGFVLDLYLYSASNKELGVRDIYIYGKVDGESEDVSVYSLGIAANPEYGGQVSVYPNAASYDEGTEVRLTAVSNFGYGFVNWTDSDGKVISDKAEFMYTVKLDANLTANFEKIETYELAYDVEGGANAYQVQLTPDPTVVSGRNMYEAGTNVTLTAVSNPIMTFTNWSDGQTTEEISLVMDSDKKITASFAAADYIVGWDFWRSGNDGRPADFYTDGNDNVQLVLRNASGATSSWLDKSQSSDPNGYEGRNATVNWRTTGLGDYYWQTKIDASAFSDIHVAGGMLYNYNAYTVYDVEASLDAETWDKVGSVTIEGVKKWTDYDFTLPAKFDNGSGVYIRWIADKSSAINGTQSNNDGISMSATYITGTPKLVDDGTAPVLLSVVPEDNSSSASITGRVVLTFDEKIQLVPSAKAVLKGNGSELELTGEVSGKTVMFSYKNLAYGTSYTFELPAWSVADLTDNKYGEAVTISFSTRNRDAVVKTLYDFIVPDDGTFKDAIAAADNRSDKNTRFRIFVKKGRYELPWSETTNITNNGVTLPNPITYLSSSNVSIIGEDRESTEIKNLMKDVTPSGTTYPIEGLHNVATLLINKKVTNTYIQDIALVNGMNDNTGRGGAFEDCGDKTICKNVTLWGYQDTYLSNNDGGRFYFEGGVLRGRTDYLCGKGDVYYKDVVLQMCAADGGFITAPSTPRLYGYVFKDCEVVVESDELNGRFTLGRPWGEGTPTAIFIDTKMTAQPSAAGWSEMSSGWPKRFAEYNSFTASGTAVDMSNRKTVFASTHTNNPVLTKEEADGYSYDKVMGASDSWDPAGIAEAAPLPSNVRIDGGSLVWDDNEYVLCWAVCADGKVIDFTIDPKYDVDTTADVVYSVRSANEMGGLGEAVVAGSTGIRDVVAESEVVSTAYYNIQGMRVTSAATGVLIKVDTLRNGKTVTSKVIR